MKLSQINKLRNKTKLFTGTAGFIGSNLCEYLLENDVNVLGVDNFVTGHNHNLIHLENKSNFKFSEFN